MIRMVRVSGHWRVSVGRLVIYQGRRFGAACAALRLARGIG